MKRLAFLCLALGFAASAQAKLNVVATLPDYAAVAREVGGDLVEVTTLAKPTEDPHFVDARPSFVVKLRDADILIEGGAELEVGWLPPLLQNARNAKIAAAGAGHVVACAGLKLLNVPAVATRAAGDVHAMGNPHFMVDPIIAKAVALNIAQAFAKADPANAAAYQANEQKFEGVINAKLQEWGAALLPYKGQSLVSYHDGWLYFTHRFGFALEIFLEPKPGIPPSPAHLAAVIGKMRAAKAKVILVEPYQNRKTAEKVASSTGASIVEVSQFPGALPNTEGYVALMDALVARLVAALKGA